MTVLIIIHLHCINEVVEVGIKHSSISKHHSHPVRRDINPSQEHQGLHYCICTYSARTLLSGMSLRSTSPLKKKLIAIQEVRLASM